MSGSIHSISPVASAAASLATRLQSHLLENGLTHVKFAEQCGVSTASIARALRNEALRDETIRRIEAGLSGQPFAGDSEQALDPSIELMIEMIVADSTRTGRIAGVGTTAYQKWRKLQGIEENAAYAEQMLRQYARAENDKRECLRFFMELCVTAKTPISERR